MLTIFKYPIPLENYFTLLLPIGAKILSIQLQEGNPYLWVLVDTEARQKEHHFVALGTGHPLPSDVDAYIGTFQLPDLRLVLHIFEKKA